MIDANPLKCSDLSIDKIMKEIKKSITEIKPNGKIFRIVLDDIPLHIYRGIDFRAVREASKGAVHYEIKANVLKEGKSKPLVTSKIGALVNEFEMFFKKQNIDEKEILLKLGVDYIEKIEAKEERK